MCARYVIISTPNVIRALFAYEELPNFPPRYNVAPTQPIPVVRLADGRRSCVLVRWGFLPAWVKDPKGFSLIINARGESVLDKPSFRNAMRRRRCLIPADGFYEWRDGTPRRPYFVRGRSAGPIAFAGLWETWTGPNGEEVDTAAIVTTGANRTLAALHHRMPVIVAPDAFDLWLDCARVDAEMAAALIAPAADDLLEFHEVSSAVNRAVNDAPDLIAPAPAPAIADGDAQTESAPAAKKTKPDGQMSLF
jgi:putative SOS response-associated peptidase YedK